jgi:hypothetical protein
MELRSDPERLELTHITQSKGGYQAQFVAEDPQFGITVNCPEEVASQLNPGQWYQCSWVIETDAPA